MIYGDFEPIEMVKVGNGKKFEWRSSKRTQREALTRLLDRNPQHEDNYRLSLGPSTVTIVWRG